MRKIITSPLTLTFFAVALTLATSAAMAAAGGGTTNPFGDLVPSGGTTALDTGIANVAKFLVIGAGAVIIGGGLFYGGSMILGKARDASTSKDGSGGIFGSIVMSVGLIVVTALIGGALIAGADGVATLIDGVFA